MDRATLWDDPRRYGLVTRFFHWAMAYLLLWQFATLAGWLLLGDGPVMDAVFRAGPAHGTVGILVVVLLLPRLGWRRMNRRRPVDPTPQGRLARTVHGLFYILMVLVPGLALVRVYGEGKGLVLWGMDLLPVTGRNIGWLIGPADMLHGPLAWILAVLMAGHIIMALAHGVILRDGLLSRMVGPLWTGRHDISLKVRT